MQGTRSSGKRGHRRATLQQTLHDLDPAAQDAQANDLMNAFDFTQTPLPPLVLKKRGCL